MGVYVAREARNQPPPRRCPATAPGPACWLFRCRACLEVGRCLLGNLRAIFRLWVCVRFRRCPAAAAPLSAAAVRPRPLARCLIHFYAGDCARWRVCAQTHNILRYTTSCNLDLSDFQKIFFLSHHCTVPPLLTQHAFAYFLVQNSVDHMAPPY